MLVDASGAALPPSRSTPLPSADNGTDNGTGPASPSNEPAPTAGGALTDEQQREVVQDYFVVREALRNLGTQMRMATAQKIPAAQIPLPDAFWMIGACAAALDQFLERRMVDENGVRIPLPESMAPQMERIMAQMVAAIAAGVKREAAAASSVQVFGAYALAQLPPDAEAALRGPIG